MLFTTHFCCADQCHYNVRVETIPVPPAHRIHRSLYPRKVHRTENTQRPSSSKTRVRAKPRVNVSRIKAQSSYLDPLHFQSYISHFLPYHPNVLWTKAFTCFFRQIFLTGLQVQNNCSRIPTAEENQWGHTLVSAWGGGAVLGTASKAPCPFPAPLPTPEASAAYQQHPVTPPLPPTESSQP